MTAKSPIVSPDIPYKIVGGMLITLRWQWLQCRSLFVMETIMERYDDRDLELIDLGEVTEETKGGVFGKEDSLNTLQIGGGGLSDD
jgi:hypothetical protein